MIGRGPSTVTDWGVPAIVAGVSLLEVALVAPDGAAAASVLSVLSCLALVPRRRWPVPTTLVAGALTVVQTHHVCDVGQLPANEIVTPGIFVDGIVAVPNPAQEEDLNRADAHYPEVTE